MGEFTETFVALFAGVVLVTEGAASVGETVVKVKE